MLSINPDENLLVKPGEIIRLYSENRAVCGYVERFTPGDSSITLAMMSFPHPLRRARRTYGVSQTYALRQFTHYETPAPMLGTMEVGDIVMLQYREGSTAAGYVRTISVDNIVLGMSDPAQDSHWRSRLRFGEELPAQRFVRRHISNYLLLKKAQQPFYATGERKLAVVK